jgi:hypothetical protein
MSRFANCLLYIGFCLVSPEAHAQKPNVQYQPNWVALEAQGKLGFDSQPLDSEVLREAYAELFIMTEDRHEPRPSWWEPAKQDLVKRGNSATPLLTTLFKEHPLQQFRDDLLRKIENYPSIDIAPFLELARSYWRDHKYTTPPRTCYGIARILSRHGSKEDQAILAEMKNHPTKEVGFVIEPDIDRMAKRLNGTLKPSEWHDALGRPPKGYDWPETTRATKAPTTTAQTSPPSEEPDASRPWSIIIVLIAAVGLLWMLLTKRE